jgi:hypothetical protein
MTERLHQNAAKEESTDAVVNAWRQATRRQLSFSDSAAKRHTPERGVPRRFSENRRAISRCT